MCKKLLAFMLSLALLLSFAGCSQLTDVRGDVTPNPTTEATTETTTEATTEATTEVTTEATTVATTEPEFSIGSSTGNTYKNEFIGIQCSLDSNWVFKTDAEMQAVNETAAGLVGDEYKDAITSIAVIQDMMATHVNQMDTVSVVLEKLNGAALLITEEQYMSLSKDSAVNALTSMGLNITSSEMVTVQLAGEEHIALAIAGDFSGLEVYEYMVVVKCNGYMACITACTWVENTCMDILSQFQPC